MDMNDGGGGADRWGGGGEGQWEKIGTTVIEQF